MRKGIDLSGPIRQAAERDGLGIEAWRRKKKLPGAHFYKLAQGKNPIPEKCLRPLRRLKAAGVQHPLLDMVS